MDNDYGYGATAATILAVYAITLIFMLIVAAGFYVLMSLALSSFFKKVGVEGWIAWVPIYNNWKWLEVGGQPGWLALLAFVPFGSYVTLVFMYIGMYRTGKAFGKDTGFLVLGILLPWVWLFILGFGRDEYRPELIAAAGLPGPLEGRGARVAADGITVPFQYGATPYPATYPAPYASGNSYAPPTMPAPEERPSGH